MPWRLPILSRPARPVRKDRRSAVGSSFEQLESRDVPSVFTVTNLADSGPGTLRAQIVAANANPDADIIRFADNLAGGTISLTGIAHTPEGGSALRITSPITIIGNGETITRPAPGDSYRLFRVEAGANLSLQYLTLRGGKVVGGTGDGSNGAGGAVLNLGTFSANDCTFVQNSATGTGAGLGRGGALINAAGATATLTRCLFQGNQAVSGPTGAGAVGGGVASDGTLNVFVSAFVNNLATAAQGNTVAQGRGGGVAVFGTGDIRNTTFSGNTARSFGPAAVGGGLFNVGTTRVAFSTLAGNAASSSPAANGNGGAAANRGTLTLQNSIFFGSTAGTSDVLNFFEGTAAVLNVAAPNIIGTLLNTGGTVVGNGAVSVDPRLGPLQDNGGPTPTMALQQNSPALNAGAVGGGLVSVIVDQRGTARDATPDLGAYEVQHPLSPVGVPSDFPSTYNPRPSADANEAFIKGLYQSTLLRQGTVAEVAFYVQQLQNGTLTRQQAANAFYNSPENRGNQVRFFYSYFLHRTPSQAEVNFYVQVLQSGVDEGAVMANFILSPEFTGQTTNPQFVNLMYYAILGRGATTAEVNFYVSRLNNGQATRGSVLNNFLRSAEGIGRVVRGDYVAYLKRVPSAAELSSQTAQITGGATFGSVAIGVLSSQEFFSNAGQNL